MEWNFVCMKMFREMADVVWQFQSVAVDDKDAVTLHKSIYVINLEMFWLVGLTMILFSSSATMYWMQQRPFH